MVFNPFNPVDYNLVHFHISNPQPTNISVQSNIDITLHTNILVCLLITCMHCCCSVGRVTEFFILGRQGWKG